MAEKTIRGWDCTISELAEIAGFTRKTIHDAIQSGCPVVKSGTPGKGNATIINVHAFIVWRESRLRNSGNNKPEDKDILNEIKIEKAQLDLAERRGDLFHLEDWRPLIEDRLIIFRNEMDGIHKEVIDDFPDTPGIRRIAAAVQSKVIRCLNQLAQRFASVPSEAQGDRLQ